MIHLNGIVDCDVDEIVFLDSFLPWLESKGWSYCGSARGATDEELLENVAPQSKQQEFDNETMY